MVLTCVTVDVCGNEDGLSNECQPMNFPGTFFLTLSDAASYGLVESKSKLDPFHDESNVALEYPESVNSVFPLASLSVGEISKVSNVPNSNPPFGLNGDT